MKLLTINTHSLAQKGSENADILARAIKEEAPDVISMQEVNQTQSAKIVPSPPIITNDIVRSDNFALQVLNRLEKNSYYASWLAVKTGYGKFDEGLALLSKSAITDVFCFTISEKDDYNDWKTRKTLGIKTSGEWFFCIHTGWWHDNDSFSKQWEKLKNNLPVGKVWLMGDFNNSAETSGEGYELIIKDGWLDSYALAETKDNGYTVETEIDGWKKSGITKVRIDYIFNNYKCKVKRSSVIFDGKNRPRISDHYGVLIETERLI